MSNKLFQNLVYQMREAVDRDIGIIDEKGTIIACSQLARIGESQIGKSTRLNSSHAT